MNRRVLIIYYIISVAFLLAITGLGAYRITRRAEANLRASRRDLEALRITALSTYLASGGFDTDFFRSSMRDNFRRTPRLRLVALYSREGGLYYLLSANPELVGPEEPGGPAGSGGQERLPGSPPGWGGAPSYRLRPLVHVRLSVPFSLGRRSDAVPPPGLVLDAVFLRLDREDLYPILRELFFVLLVYLAITTLLLLIAALSPPASGAARPAAPRPRRGRLALPDGDPASASDSSSSAESRQSGLYSPDTGLGWRDFLAERLNQELERAASFDQDLALLLLGVKPRAAAGPPERRRYLYRRLSQHTLQSFPLRDLDFEYDQHTVAVILPERSLNRALEEAQGFQRKLLQAPWGGAGSVRVYAGLSSRSGRLISGTRLLVEASRALKRADAAGNNQIIAFRADPQKYRQVLFSGRG